MSAQDGRLDRVVRELTARERVLMLHMALLEDREPDPAIRATIPPAQGPEFNRYAALANGVFHVITARALALHYETELLSLKFLLLATQVMWGFDRTSLIRDASLLAAIPIPLPEYERRLDELRRERLPIRDVVELMLSGRGEESGAARRRAERDVRAAVKAGDLPSSKRGRGFEVEMGKLFDWMSEPLEPYPEWGWRYEPIAEGELDRHSLRLAAVGWLHEQLGAGPSHPARVLEAMSLGGSRASATEVEPANEHDRLTGLLARDLPARIPALSAELAAIETVAGEICAELGDDGVIPDVVRRFLVTSRDQLETVASRVGAFVGPVALADAPDEGLLRELRRQVQGGAA